MQLPKEIIIALFAAIVSLIGSILTLVIGLRKIRIERHRNLEQASVWQAEISKLRVESQKLAVETQEIQRKRFEAEREEIRDLLKLFDRAVFDAPMYSEDPTEMFRAIQQTRISLQLSGASLVRDSIIADNFKQIRKLLLDVEGEVTRNYPIIVELATNIDDFHDRIENRRKAHELLRGRYYEPVRLMMDVRHKLDKHIEVIQKRFRELSGKIE